MKKLFGCILSLVVAVMLVFTPAEHVYAQGLGLSVSSSSVAVGKTVKVTVSMPSGYFGTVVISSSDEGVLSTAAEVSGISHKLYSSPYFVCPWQPRRQLP